MQGGVKLTRSSDEALEFVNKMLGDKLVTKQTSKEGCLVNDVMVAEALDISTETYLAVLMDRDSQGPAIVASPEGGVDIEEVAKSKPEAIIAVPIDIHTGPTEEQISKIVSFLKLDFSREVSSQASTQIRALYDFFIKHDAIQVEINPLGLTPQNRVVCFDAKINFDDNAQFRQKQIYAMDNNEEKDWREMKAEEANLNYIGLDGNIGCLVNGAGLAMATMDIIKLHGGEPANFLDVGGGVTTEGVTKAFQILTQDKQVKAILVNVFGGIVNCATISEGVINACKAVQPQIPIVCRLAGTNVDEAYRMLQDSQLPLLTAVNLDDAARKAVAALQQ